MGDGAASPCDSRGRCAAAWGRDEGDCVAPTGARFSAPGGADTVVRGGEGAAWLTAGGAPRDGRASSPMDGAGAGETCAAGGAVRGWAACAASEGSPSAAEG